MIKTLKILIFFILTFKHAYGDKFYSVSTNPQKHIFTLNIEIINNKKINVTNEFCYKCYKKKSKIDLSKGFIKINCSNTRYDGEEFHTICNKFSVGGAAPYRKSIAGDIKEAKLTGLTQLELIEENNLGTVNFIFLNENEYALYKNYLQDNFFITTQEFKTNFKNNVNLEIDIDNELKQLEKEKKRLEKLKKIREERLSLQEEKIKLEKLKKLEEQKKQLEEEIKNLKEE